MKSVAAGASVKVPQERDTASRRHLFFPVPLVCWLLLALTAGAAFASTLDVLRAPYAEWRRVSGLWHESLMIAGPLAAAAGSVAAFSALGDRRSLMRKARGRPWFAVALRFVGPIAGLAVTGLVLAMTPVTVHAISTATAGTVSLAEVLLGLLGMVTFVVCGFSLSVIVPRRLTALISLLLGLLWTVGPAVFALQLGVSGPVRQWEMNAYDAPVGAVQLYSGFSCALLALGGLLVAGVVMRDPDAGARRFAVGALVVVAVALIGYPFLWRPYVAMPVRDLPVSCLTVTTAGKDVRVCVPQAYERDLPTLAQATRRVSNAGGAPLIDRVDAVKYGTAQPGVMHVMIRPGESQDAAAADLARLAAFPSCYRSDRDTEGDAGLADTLASRLTADSLGVDPGPMPRGSNSAVATTVWSASGAELREFIATHATQIRTCRTLTVDPPPPSTGPS